MIRLKDLMSEGFTNTEKSKVMDAVKSCFEKEGNNGVRNGKILNKYLGKLNFEVDESDIEIGGWTPNSYNRQIKSAEVKLQGKTIGYIQNI